MDITTRSLKRPAGIALTVVAAGVVTVLCVSLASQNADRAHLAEKVTSTQTLRGDFDHDQLTVYPKLLKSKLAHEAAATTVDAQAVLASAAPVIDVAVLAGKVEALNTTASLSSKQIAVLIQDTKTETATTASAAATEVARRAAEAARIAAEKEAAIAATRNPDSARALGASLAASNYGWGPGEFACLNNLWTKESNWRYDAVNSSGGATGIPQSLPGSKMATFGADYLTNPATQISWGLDYIKRSYGSPCGAWNHSVRMNWY